MKHRLLLLLVLLAAGVSSARAAIVYSGIQNVSIPQDFEGIYFRIDTGFSTGVAPGDWNTAPWMNPFFGGVEIANSALFRPVVTGGTQVVNLPFGTTIGSGSNFVAGESGSVTHFGNSPGQFPLNTPGYLGATFRQTVGGPDYYGWVQMEMNNASTGKIISWAFENTSGASILAGQTVSAVPEPGTVVFGLAVIFAGVSRRVRSRR